MLLFFQVFLFYLALFNFCTLIMSFSCCTIPCGNHFMLQFFSGGTNLCISLRQYFIELISNLSNSNDYISHHFQNAYPETVLDKVRKLVGSCSLSISLLFLRNSLYNIFYKFQTLWSFTSLTLCCTNCKSVNLWIFSEWALFYVNKDLRN